MYIPKRYGETIIAKCPFCGRQALTKNIQRIPVCIEHKNEKLNEIKCACGEWLDIREGKFGVFFNCIKCGNINMSRAVEMNQSSFKPNKTSAPREITVTSDELEFL
jgi:predicted RNA-binding Zn-ribbon protein involved in translation (DUF1610 family)